MLLPRNTRKNLISACVLGILACLTCMLSLEYTPKWSILLPGSVFVLIAAESLGLSAVIISSLFLLAPYVAAGTSWQLILRIPVLALAVMALKHKRPFASSLSVGLLLWAIVMGPVCSLIATGELRELAVPFSMAALCDLWAVCVAGALLHIRPLWVGLTQNARQVPLKALFRDLGQAIATSLIFAAAMVFAHAAPTSLAAAALPQLVVIGAVFIIATSVLCSWVGALLMRNPSEYFPGYVIARGQGKSFSGLSTDFWRRQTESPLAPRERKDTASQIELPPNIRAEHNEENLGICAITGGRTVSFCNRRFLRFAEVTTNECVGKHLDTLAMNPLIKEAIESLLTKPLSTGSRRSEVKLNQLPDNLRFYEIRIQRADNTSTSTLTSDAQGVILTIKDITERRTVESHLLQSQKLGSLGHIIGGIAHSFNNSLTSIIGQASFARAANDPTVTEQSLDAILSAAHGAGNLVRKLLDFAEGRPMPMKRENVGRILTEQFDLLKKMAGENVEVTLDTATSQPLGAEIDTNLLTQALSNLVLNARESYAGKTGQIAISLAEEEIPEEVAGLHIGARAGRFVRIRVKDFGCGMAQDVLARAFDPLFTTKGSAGKSGLGLSIVYAIVRAHDGFLTAESQVDKGTSISIYLPYFDCPVEATDEHKENGRPIYGTEDNDFVGNQERILVVEDEPQVRELVAAMLSTLNYRVTACGTGQEALERCKSRKFDLALIDQVLPRMPGPELAGILKSRDDKVKTVMMTGYGPSANQSKTVSFIIPKPFDLQTLARAIKAALSPTKSEDSKEHVAH